MKTILLSTNFSQSSNQALRYTTALAADMGVKKLVLYNMYPACTNTSDIAPAFVEAEGVQSMSEEKLLKSKQLAADLLPETVTVATRSDFGLTKQQIDDVAQQLQADLIVTGIESTNAWEEAFDDSTSVHIVHNSQTPVLMVPVGAEWRTIKNIVWACCFKHLSASTPSKKIRQLLQDTGATLHILHNDPKHVQTEESLHEIQQQIRNWFPETNIQFAVKEERDLKETICKYISENKIDLLVSTPRKHNWLENFISPCHSQQLAVKAHIPVLCVHSAA